MEYTLKNFDGSNFLTKKSNMCLIFCNARIAWVDLSKGIGIILVIVAHILNQCATFQELSKLIYSFHMPLFFILSGYVISEKTRSLSFTELVKKYASSLLYPYWFYTLANIIISLVCKQDFSISTVSRYLSNFLFFRGWNATWFLPALFVALITAIILLKHFSVKWNLLFSFTVCIIIAIIPIHPNIIKVLILGILALPFIMTGYLLKKFSFIKIRSEVCLGVLYYLKYVLI